MPQSARASVWVGKEHEACLWRTGQRRMHRAAPSMYSDSSVVAILAPQQRAPPPRRAEMCPLHTWQPSQPPAAQPLMASLKYSPACIPYGALAAALARGLTLSAEEDAKLPRDALPTLTLPTG